MVSLSVRKRNIMMLYFIALALWFSQYNYVPTFPNYAKQISPNLQFAGLILAAYGVTQATLRLPVGIMSDASGKRKPFAVLGMVCCLLSGLGLYFFPTPWATFISRGMAGVASATWAIYMSMYISFFDQSQRHKHIGIINSINSLGQMLGLLVGAIIVRYANIKLSFLIGAVICAFGLLACLSIKENTPSAESADTPITRVRFQDVLKVLTNHNMLFYSSLCILLQIVTFSSIFGFTPVLLEEYGASGTAISFCATIYILPAIFTSARSGALVKSRFGAQNIIIAAFILGAVCMFAHTQTRQPVIILAAIFAFGIARGALFSMLNIMAVGNIDKSMVSTAISTYQAIYSIGMTIGPAIAGTLSDRFGLVSCFAFLTVVSLLGALFMFIWKLRTKSV